MASSKQARTFQTMTADEISALKENITSKQTKKVTSVAVNAFREYLLHKQVSADFENMNAAELDKHLGCFFVEMRNKDGSLYKKTTLTTYRHAIQRHLAAIRDDVNIIHGDNLKNSKTLFVAQTR